MEATGVVDVLRASPFTAGLGGGERRRLSAFARVVSAAPDEVLIREGEPTPYLGILTGGRVALRMRLPGRSPITVMTVEPGDIVGWSAVLAPYRATSTVIAVEPTELIALDGGPLRAALESDEDLAAALYPRILRSVARRLEGTRLQLLDLFGQPEDRAW
jgi:CRP/FNR family transcriptional regulator, cyclic AMP receptor protein